MKKIKIIPLTLFTSISVIGLVSCSGSTQPPIVEPPKPEVIPPTLIEKKVNLIVPGLAGESAGAGLLVKDVEYVKLIKSTYPSMPNIECFEYSIKFKNDKEASKLGTVEKDVITSYNNWLEVNNDE